MDKNKKRRISEGKFNRICRIVYGGPYVDAMKLWPVGYGDFIYWAESSWSMEKGCDYLNFKYYRIHYSNLIE